MSKEIRKQHNVSILVYHLVCPIKYRRNVITDKVKYTIMRTCETIASKYEIYFIEVGTDLDHVHFLVQTVPTYSPTKLVTIIKSLIAKAVFKYNPEVKRYLWGGEFWTDGYYIKTVSDEVDEKIVANYVREQGNGSYKQVSKDTKVSPNSSM